MNGGTVIENVGKWGLWSVLALGVVAGLLAVVHFVWLVKADLSEPLLYGAVLGLLLLARLPAVRAGLAAGRRLVQARFRRPAAAPLPGSSRTP